MSQRIPETIRSFIKSLPVWKSFPVLVLGALSLNSCKDLSSVIESQQFTVPTISFVSPIRDSIDTYLLPGGSKLPSDNVTVTLTVQVRAFDSIGISGVAGTVSSPSWPLTNEGSTTLANFSLADDGLSPDKKANDSLFTGQVSFQIFRYEVGTYYLRLQAFNNLNTASTQLAIPFTLINSNNHPPHIDSLVAVPDTLLLVDTAITVGRLSAKVSDPESSRDILSVTSRATKPDGTDANTVVYLFDDGDPSHADLVRGDGFFSSGVKLDPHSQPPPEKGRYVFHFTATDKSGAIGRDSLAVIVK